MGLSHNFGIPGTRAINQAGDYAFLGEGGRAVFLLSHTAASGSTPTRILQFGDEVPGFPGSKLINFGNVQLNDNGLLAIQAGASLSNGQSLSIIFSYNGTFTDLVDSTMPAPGQGGAKYLDLSLLGLDNSGDLAFLSAPGSNSEALYIAMNGSSAVLAASFGQAAPGTGGTFGGFLTGTVISSLIPPQFNNSGQLLMASDISGGAGGVGLFVFSTAGIRKVAANGDPNPLGGLFTLSDDTAWGVFNNQGLVAFIAGNPAGSPGGNSIFINSPTSATTGTTTVVAGAGGAAPPSLGGTMSFVQPLPATIAISHGWLDLDDNGDIAAVATLSGSAVTSQALLRFTASPANSTTYSIQVAAYTNEAAPGVTGEIFSFIQDASINNSGLITFLAQMRNTSPPGLGTVLGGIFQQPAGGAVSQIVLNGQAVSGLAGGGNFLLYTNDAGGLVDEVSQTTTLNNGTVFFSSDVSSGAAYHAEFSWTGGVLRILMNTGQALPAGATVRLTPPRSAGNSVAFLASYAGGQGNLVVHDIVGQTTQAVAYEGELATGTSSTIKSLGQFHVNSKGHVAFRAGLTGGSSGGTGIFVATPGAGISKITAAGDTDPATGNTMYEQVLPSVFPGTGFTPFNDSDQVAFTALDSIPGEVFVGAPGSTPVKVASQNDLAVPLLQTNAISLNNQGVLAFLNVPPFTQTVTSTGVTLTPEAIITAVPTASTPAYSLNQITRTGNGTGVGQFSVFKYPSLNNLGSLAVGASLVGGSAAGGIFVGNGSGGGALAVDGTAAPAGGNFSIPGPLFAEINDQSDVTFTSPLSGGSANSGIFVRRGSTITAANPVGVLTAPILAGQPAPGSPGTFSTFAFGATPPILGSTGDIAVEGAYTTGGPNINGIWHIRSDDTVEPMVVQGTVASEFGGGTLVASSAGFSWNTGTTPGLGQFPIYGVVSGGSFLDAIFLFEPGINTNNTPVGTNVIVSPTDTTTGTSPATLTFSTVTTAGNTSLTIASAGPSVPSGFTLGNPPVFYDLSTTAVFSGPITICINTAAVSFSSPQNLRLLSDAGGTWTDVTTSVAGSVVCGTATSLSVFTVANLLPPLTVTAGSAQITYGSAVPAITPSYSGFVNGDTAASLTTPATCTTTATSSSLAGSYPTTCSGAVDGNYRISYVSGTVTVTPAPLNVTASNALMTYGGAVPAITASYAGFVNGDTVASLSPAASCISTATSASPAGFYSSVCSGAFDANYNITYSNGTVTVKAASLFITAPSVTINAGSAIPSFTPSYSGFVNGDNASSLTTLPTCTTTATSSSPGGSYPITCSGAVDGNYGISYVGGTLTIQVVLASIAVTPANGSITLSSTTGTLQFTATGVYSDGSKQNLTSLVAWSSTATGVATISNTSGSQGLATTAGVGSTTIGATLGGLSGSTGLTVTPGFIYTGGLNTGRTFATATVLNNGLVLIAGGGGPSLTSAELYNPATGTFTPTGSLNIGRDNATATLLNNGMVLIAGGENLTEFLASAELYNPATGTFTLTGSLNTARVLATATLLNNGMVLIAGGTGNGAGYLASAELYNPATGTFTPTGSMNVTRTWAAAALLNNGMVLIASGFGGTTGFLTSAELYNPATGTFTLTGNMNTARRAATATLLNNGLVLVAAGANSGSTETGSAELYNPATGTFASTGNLNTPRFSHTATRLNNGQVLIAGGDGNSGVLSSAELYDPATGMFTVTGSLNAARVAATAALLNDGRPLIAGGGSGVTLTSAELYEPGTLAPPNLVSISLNPSNPTIFLGTAQRLTATGTFSDGSVQQLASVTWSSSNPSTATVTNDATNVGAVYAVARGTTTISACTGTLCGSTIVTVSEALVITASSTSMVYGAATPSITASYAGFLNGDTPASLTTQPTCTTTATSSSPVGSYPTTCSGASDPNYTINYVSGTVTVIQAPLTITAPSVTINAGSAIPSFIPTYSGFVNGQNSGNLTTPPTCVTTATSSSPGGTYPITCSGAVASNYSISYVAGTLTINQAKVILSSYQLAAVGNGYFVSATLTNTGNVAINQLNLNAATLGGVAPLNYFPAGTTISNIAPGASANFTITFPTTAGAAGKGVPLSLSGNYTAAFGLSGNWAASLRSVTLP